MYIHTLEAFTTSKLLKAIAPSLRFHGKVYYSLFPLETHQWRGRFYPSQADLHELTKRQYTTELIKISLTLIGRRAFGNLPSSETDIPALLSN